MKNEIINSLNAEQAVALQAIHGAVLVTAGAGSGKTRLLTHRIVHLMENLNVDPYNILAITFTNKAANEMKERVINLCPQGEKVWISTFHSMCVRILRQHINTLDPRFNQNFSIYADTESEKVVKTLLASENVSDDKIKKNVLFHLSKMKNGNIPFIKYKQDIAYDRDAALISKIMAGYQNTLTENNALDFDDLLVKTYELFTTHPEVLERYSSRFRFILVDEFQDTNTIQYDLVKLLASTHGNVFVVGDEDQCIYTWRGANFQNISNFKKDFSAVQVFKLEQNYRSTKTILSTANTLIKHNSQRIDKTLWSDNQQGEPIEYKTVYDEQTEADFIASKIHSLVNYHGYKYSDFAILLRLNALSLPFEEKLLSYNIPHKIYGGFKFYERAEIKNVLAYLKLFINPKDDQAFIRIINFPKRGIGDTSIKRMQEIGTIYQQSLLEIALDTDRYDLPTALKQKLDAFSEIYKTLVKDFEHLALPDFCETVIEKFGIKNAYNEKIEEELDKLLNIDQLMHSIKTFAEKNPFDTLSNYLQSVSLISDIDGMGGDDSVIVATVHAVKGLEFRVVFLPALEENMFPISRAMGDNAQMEEERRLMYVGITRAKEKLFVSSARTRYLYGRRSYTLESRFVQEAGLSKLKPKPSFDAMLESRFGSNTTNLVFQQVQNITSGTEHQTQANQPLDYKINQKVQHPRFGVGVILSIDLEERTGDIDFETLGVKTLMLDIAPLTKLD